MSKLTGKSVLITGGTGTIRQGLVRAIIDQPHHHWPKKLTMPSRDEFKQYESQKRFPSEHIPLIEYTLADVSDYDTVLDSITDVDVIIHTAALKRKEFGEVTPEAFFKTNVIGTTNVLRAAKKQKSSTVVTISTDKAVDTSTLYGATKLCAEKNTLYRNDSASVIGLDNVFGSRGSIVNELKKCSSTKEIVITHPDMARFSTTITQASSYILGALDSAIGGEIFIPKMKAYRLTDLLSVVHHNTEYSFSSPRYTEKLHKSLFSAEEVRFDLERDHDCVICTNKSVQQYYYKNKGATEASLKEYTSKLSPFLSRVGLQRLLTNPS